MREDCGVSTDRTRRDPAAKAPLRERKGKTARNAAIAAVAVLLLGACAWAVLAPRDSGGWARGLWEQDVELDESKWHEVKRGPLTIGLRRTGVIHHRDKVIVRSKLEGKSTVIWLVDEGEYVEAGRLLLEMDPTTYKQRKESQDIAVIRMKAWVVNAEGVLAFKRNAAREAIEDAKLDIALAELDLKKYLGADLKDYAKADPTPEDKGQYPQLFQQGQGAIIIAKAQLERATERVGWSTELETDGYLTRTELQADVLALKKAELDLSRALSSLAVLKKYTYAHSVTALRNALLTAQRALKPVERKAAADIKQAQANRAANRSEYKRQVELQKKYATQIENCKVYAPVAGQVVYATTTSQRWREQSEQLKKGSVVWERKELFHMPNEDRRMMVVVQVPQACEPLLTDPNDGSLRKLPARVTIAGTKGKYFPGTVAKMDPLPYHEWIQAIKVFNTEIHFDDVYSELRPGYTCKVEIVVAHHEDVVSVPLQTVQLVRGKPTVYVKTPSGPAPRVVEVGMDNNRLVHVKNGLKAGEYVLLAPPLDETEADRSGRSPDKKGRRRPTTRPASGPAAKGSKTLELEAATSRPAEQAKGANEGKPARGGQDE
jgi:HlyD family secretion protein